MSDRKPTTFEQHANEIKAALDDGRTERPFIQPSTGTSASPEGERNGSGDALTQANVLVWAVDSFGAVARNRDERAARLVEEAIEVAQAEGLSAELLAKITARVYSRPPGNIAQELGGVALTALAMAEIAGVDYTAAAQAEWTRVLSKPKDWWTRKHAEKVAAGTADLSPSGDALLGAGQPNYSATNEPTTDRGGLVKRALTGAERWIKDHETGEPNVRGGVLLLLRQAAAALSRPPDAVDTKAARELAGNCAKVAPIVGKAMGGYVPPDKQRDGDMLLAQSVDTLRAQADTIDSLNATQVEMLQMIMDLRAQLDSVTKERDEASNREETHG